MPHAGMGLGTTSRSILFKILPIIHPLGQGAGSRQWGTLQIRFRIVRQVCNTNTSPLNKQTNNWLATAWRLISQKNGSKQISIIRHRAVGRCKTLEGKVEIKGLLKSKGKGFWLYTGQNTKKTCSDKLSRHIFHPAQNLTSIFIWWLQNQSTQLSI